VNVVLETVYKGHEIVVMESVDGTFLVDVRADAEDGPIIFGYMDLPTREAALSMGKAFIDEPDGHSDPRPPTPMS
jgi:hypothetical protein